MISKRRFKDALRIIEQFKQEQKLLSEIENENLDCALNRLPKNCSIIQYTSQKTCDGCGHNKK
jgi:hypothetical protein